MLRLGGEPVVTAFVSETIDATAADPRLNQSFRNTDIARIKRLIVEQICDLAGGGCHYSGDSMREVHANHHITQAQFFGLVENLRRAMRRHHVNLRARNELLALLAPMAPDCHQRRDPATAQGSGVLTMATRIAHLLLSLVAASCAHRWPRRPTSSCTSRPTAGAAVEDAVVYAVPAVPAAPAVSRELQHRSGQPGVRAAGQRRTDGHRGQIPQQRQHPPLGVFVLAAEGLHP